jgi:DNA-binding MarR family transcriptional regulator
MSLVRRLFQSSKPAKQDTMESESVDQDQVAATPQQLGPAIEDFLLTANILLDLFSRSRLLADCGISIEEWMLLRLLEKNKGALTVNELARASGIQRKRLAQLLIPLIEKQLVTRATEPDKKVATITIAPKAHVVLGKAALGFAAIAGKSARLGAKSLSRSQVISRRVHRAIRSWQKSLAVPAA